MPLFGGFAFPRFYISSHIADRKADQKQNQYQEYSGDLDRPEQKLQWRAGFILYHDDDRQTYQDNYNDDFRIHD
jgi:hypothetical protein